MNSKWHAATCVNYLITAHQALEQARTALTQAELSLSEGGADPDSHTCRRVREMRDILYADTAKTEGGDMKLLDAQSVALLLGHEFFPLLFPEEVAS